MRKQIISGMLLLLLLILPVSLYLQINQGFQQSVSNARESALHEEAAVARVLMTEIQRQENDSSARESSLFEKDDDARVSALEEQRQKTEENIRKTARKTAQQFGSPHLRILIFMDGTPLTGTLPDRSAFLMDTSSRSTYLSSADEAMYVIHPLNERFTLITISDFSGFYAMRREQTTYGILICLGGIALATVLALLISGRITRRLSILSRSADAVRSGADFTLAPSGKHDEIGKLTDAFIAMNDAVEKREESLREQARQRQQLIDALAHEMRTPLTSVISAARLIQKDTTDADMRNEMCDLIVRESRRLSDMDTNLMKLTQMNGTELETEEFSLLDAAREALAVTPEAELSGVDSVVTADRALIIHLMRNLVNNALKSGTKTPVQVVLHPRGFSVSDEGRGMTPEELKQCTEPFWKADPARTRASGGAGLGLTICKSIARLHGTSLEIRSTPGTGTSVEFTLPLHPCEYTETADQVSCG